MLKTLMKHELRATARTFLWLYLAFVGISTVNALIAPGAIGNLSVTPAGATNIMMPNIVQGTAMVLYIVAIAAIAIVTFVVIILRFFRNLLGDEGYLMFTLPVTREQHVMSKLLVAVMWCVCSTVLVILSVFVMIGAFGASAEISNALTNLISTGLPLGRYVLTLVIMLILASFAGVLMLYLAMAIGPNLLKNRVGGSTLAFIIIVIAYQIISGIVAVSMMAAQSGYIASVAAVPHSVPADLQASLSIIDTTMLAGIILNAIVAVACWFLTIFMLKRKLNLA